MLLLFTSQQWGKTRAGSGGAGSWGSWCFELGKLLRILNYGNQLTRRRLSIAQAAERDQALAVHQKLFQGEIKVIS